MDMGKTLRKVIAYGVLTTSILYGGCDYFADKYLKPEYSTKLIETRRRVRRVVENGAHKAAILLDKKLSELEKEVEDDAGKRD